MEQGLLKKISDFILQNALVYSAPTYIAIYIAMNLKTTKREIIILRHYHVSGR